MTKKELAFECLLAFVRIFAVSMWLLFGVAVYCLVVQQHNLRIAKNKTSMLVSIK